MLVYMWQAAEKCIVTPAKVMTDGDTVFTVTGGPIAIVDILSTCITDNGGSATTMQWSSTPTVGTAKTFSGASASLASATAGTVVRLNPTALTTAPDIVTAANGGVVLGAAVANRIVVKDGTIKLVIATGPTTGTWTHALRYAPLTPDSIVNG